MVCTKGGAGAAEEAIGIEEVLLRLRMSSADAHYAGGLVDGARLLGLCGDIATELLIRHDGDEGLFVAYDNVELKAPVYAGDYIEVRGRITSVGRTSRKMVFTAMKVIAAAPTVEQPSAAEVLAEPVLVLRASGTCVVPQERQRGAAAGADGGPGTAADGPAEAAPVTGGPA